MLLATDYDEHVQTRQIPSYYCSVVRDGTKVKVKAKGLPASRIGKELPDCAAGMRKKHEGTDEARLPERTD